MLSQAPKDILQGNILRASNGCNTTDSALSHDISKADKVIGMQVRDISIMQVSWSLQDATCSMDII